MKYLYIDNVRGWAILLVILVHASQRVSGLSEATRQFAAFGQLGVQLFFLASAYTLCLSHESRRHETHWLSNFYIRRFFRIAPLYYFGIILYFSMKLMVGQIAPQNGYSPYSPVNVLANILLVHGFFPPANNVIVPGGWSIGTEVAFYAIFPLLVTALGKFNGNLRLFGLSLVFWLLLFAVGLSQAFDWSVLLLTGKSVSVSGFFYYNFFNQLPVFLFGIALFYYRPDTPWRGPLPLLAASLAIAALFFILALGWWSGIKYVFSFVPTVAAIAFFFVFLVLKHYPWLNSRVLGKIGVHSYGMYVTHFLFAWYLPKYFLNDRLSGLLSPVIIYVLVVMAAIVGSYFVSATLHRFLESPAIGLGKTLIQAREQKTASLQ